MKIVEAQNATLTNLEVYEFLNNQAKEYQAQKRRGPGNLETLRRELLQYFEAAPGPLSQKPQPFDTSAIKLLMERLRQHEITKGEFIMLVNLRPTNIPSLNTVLEDMESRYNEEQQEDIVQGVLEILGQFPAADGEGGDDADAMQTTE
ncbi:DNA-directed RNA polymerase III subunit RPC9 [Microdochium nivale]|nr:DNA-directed RNA polymerase III subunit RPC9 [Microdochium nivale]